MEKDVLETGHPFFVMGVMIVMVVMVAMIVMGVMIVMIVMSVIDEDRRRYFMYEAFYNQLPIRVIRVICGHFRHKVRKPFINLIFMHLEIRGSLDISVNKQTEAQVALAIYGL